MDDHQTLSVAFLGNVLWSLDIYLFDWPLLGASKAKHRTNLTTSFPTEIIDRWSPNFVAFLGSFLSSLLILTWWAPFQLKLKCPRSWHFFKLLFKHILCLNLILGNTEKQLFLVSDSWWPSCSFSPVCCQTLHKIQLLFSTK
jgi:hypothetical protein